MFVTRMKYIFNTLFVVCFLALSSCQQPREYDSPTYLGGQILNPKADHVLLFQNEEILDTLYLDDRNHFMKAIPVFEDGLYTFKHANEFQYIFLEPSDSLIIRLNTWDFDESLVFSGIGSVRNEYLIDVFIQNEKEDAQLRELRYLPAADLKNEIEYVRQRKQIELDEFIEESEEKNNLYIRYARAAIDYPLYQILEIYPLGKRNYIDPNQLPELPQGFYDYRSKINLNDPVLSNFYTHRNYVLSYLYHLAYMKTLQDRTVGINTNLIRYVNDSIDNGELHRSLVRSALYETFFTKASLDLNQEFTKAFFDSSTDKNLNDRVKNLISDSQYIPNGSKLSDFEIINSNLKLYGIKSVLKNRNAVIYFWSDEETEGIKLAGKLNYLQRKYPRVLFIGINLDYKEEKPLDFYSLQYINENLQFALPENSNAKSFTKSGFARSILVNRQGYVIDNYANLSSPYFENSLRFLEKN